jgi:hypothetical protein
MTITVNWFVAGATSNTIVMVFVVSAVALNPPHALA